MRFLSNTLDLVGDLAIIIACLFLVVIIPLLISVKISEMKNQSRIKHEKWLVDLRHRNDLKRQREKDMYKEIERKMMEELHANRKNDTET